MSPNDPPPSAETSAPSAPSARAPGRPGVPREAIVDAIEAWVARTGHPPTQRELRRALGDRGSMSTLSRVLREVGAERLLAGTAPERGSPEATITKALNAAMDVIAADVASTADDAIAAGAREADTRIEAADARRLRAENTAAESELERARVSGRLEELQARLDDLRDDLGTARKDAAALRARESELVDTVAALEGTVRERQSALERLETDQVAARKRIDELEGALADERSQRATLKTDAARLEAERDAAQQRATEADAARQVDLEDAARRVEASDGRAREAAAEATSIRERCAALEQARALADAARERAEDNLATLRRGDEPKIVRLLEILGDAERRREQEDDPSSSRGDDAGDD